MILHVTPSGKIRFIYSDDAIVFEKIGDPITVRASSVERSAADLQWYARIWSGPKLGPFDKRVDALTAEVKWLEKNRL